MSILNTISLESNKKIKINFNSGNLSSDGGLLLIKEFAAKVGLIKLVKKLFKTMTIQTAVFIQILITLCRCSTKL